MLLHPSSLAEQATDTDTLHVCTAAADTLVQYTLGSQPGDYVIITALSKDQLVWNVTYTTRPQVAAPLPLPFNASLHSKGRSGQADPQIGAVRDVQDLVLAVSFKLQTPGVVRCSSPSHTCTYRVLNGMH